MLVQQTDAGCPLLGRLRVPQTNARTATILFDEDDACSFKCIPDRIYRTWIEAFATLKPRDGVRRYLRCGGQIANAPAQRGPAHAALNRKHRNTVTKFLRCFALDHIVTVFGGWINLRTAGRGRWKLPTPGLTATRSIGEQAMATRAHSTTASASRRQPRQAVTAALPKASRPRRVEAGQLELPGAAALLQRLEILWKNHTALEAESQRRRDVGQAQAAAAMMASANSRVAQAEAIERVALAFPPATPADAIAQLILAHAEIDTLTSSDGDCEEAVRALLETATRAVAVLAKVHDFDLTALSFQYLTEAQRMIVRGDVLA